MIKVLLILSLVLMLAATFIGYQNGRTLAVTRANKAATHKNIRTELGHVNGLVEQVNVLIADVKRVTDELEVEKEKIRGQRLKIAQADSEAKRVQEDLDRSNMRLVELRKEMEQLPPDVKLETLQEDLNRIKQSIAETKANTEAKQQQLDAENAKVVAEQRKVDGFVRRRDDRLTKFALNSMTANITAVNSDWGFVVIDAGQPQGITESTKLLVTRGTQTIGKLSILSVEGSKTIANILQDTVTPGMTIAPGDRVILENLFQ